MPVSTNEQEGQKAGSVPNSFGNTLAWTWSREMPRYLKGGFLTMLYVLRAMAAASGELRFKDGKAIRIQDLAKAGGFREQDARRYLEAGIRARIVHVNGERKRGKATLYAIPAAAWPDWPAAVDYLKATARQRPDEEQAAQSSGHSGTNSEDEVRATEARTEPEGVRSTVDRPGSGHCGPMGSGHSEPNNPGVTQGVTHDMVDVVTQPEVIAGPAGEANEKSAGEETGQAPDEEFGRCEDCAQPLLRAGITKCSVHRDPIPGRGNRRRGSSGAGRAIQGPLLISVPGTSVAPVEALQGPPAPRREAADPFAPARICGCGRGFRDRDRSGRCPDCVAAEHEETARLAGLRGVSNA